MSAAFQRRPYETGEPVFQEGDPGDSLYVVEKGRVRIWTGDPERPTILGIVEEGGVFGEMAIFDKKPRMANASADAESVLMRMPATVMRESLYGADPLLRQLVQILIDNVRNMARRIDELEGRCTPGGCTRPD
ncbi:Crp/Fnr family transcriptional regulator [Indioceanicola profundi]|uniref:Crp/Fnr family transcriptional regulator n=1 Tax=Indioceanicola profundi TaxID=2220096 RepID=UPI000E6AD0A0|nr:cyclic nucleotide-binding domain-containing protein [Indioceanicola profundi]